MCFATRAPCFNFHNLIPTIFNDILLKTVINPKLYFGLKDATTGTVSKIRFEGHDGKVRPWLACEAPDALSSGLRYPAGSIREVLPEGRRFCGNP